MSKPLFVFYPNFALNNSERMQEGKNRVHFIINPISGVNQSHKSDFVSLAREYIDSTRFEISFSITESSEQAYQLSKEASQKGVEIIVAVGGDGTANRVVKGLFGSNSLFGLIPVGSGNGLARFLNIPLDIPKSLQIINGLNVRQIDTISINDEIFVSIAGVGFDALVAKRFAKSGRRGFFTYFHIALHAYPGYRPRKYRMVIDGNPFKRRALFISFANSNQFGYNTIIAPAATIDDGYMDISIVKKAPVIEAPYILGLLWRNKIENSAYIEMLRAKEVFIPRNKNKVVNVDGEPMKVGKDLNIKVNPLSLNIIVPTDQDR